MLAKLLKRYQLLFLILIALIGLILRLYGLNWDQGNNFHPDERQIMFHVTTLAWPSSFAQFLDPEKSPLNPHFFAYGSFPLYLLAFLGHLFVSANAPDAFFLVTLVGRVVSAIFDSATILLTGWLALLLMRDTSLLASAREKYAWSVALLAAILVAFTPLQVQLAHFYAVDSILLFFVMLTLVGCVGLVDTRRPVRWLLLAGVGYGLALATKFSAAPLAVPLFIALLLRGYRQRDYLSAFIFLFFAAALTLLVCLVAQPYALLDARNFIAQVSEQGSLARGTLDLPYVRQFAGTIPFLYEAQNMLLWGLGLTLGLASVAGLLWLLWRFWRRDAGNWLIPLSWVLVYGAITCSFYVKFMRYMLPLYPLFALMAAAVLVEFATRPWQLDDAAGWRRLWRKALPSLRVLAIVLVLGGTMFQGLALLNVYSQPNTRIQASRWMFQHLKAGTRLTYEQWDDALPVTVGEYNPAQFVQASYTDLNGQQATGMDLYGDDTTDKARVLAKFLADDVDVITMASDRLDKSIPRLPFRYPLTIHYYQLLFSGQLGFHLVAQFDNRPNLFGITLDDSSADESYSVFDHPTVRIFEKREHYTADQLFQKLLAGIQLPPGGAGLSGAQASLLLPPPQGGDTLSPTFGQQFPAGSLANQYPIVFWWVALFLLGWLAYPLLWLPLRRLADRGYLVSKLCGILLLAYFSWLLAASHLLPFEAPATWLVFAVLLVCSLLALLARHRVLLTFVSQRWRLLLACEGLFTLAFLFFVVIRAANPDLWHLYRGGEKPMELAFLNAILRSPYMPPQDPWFAGGYINYYYYGYVVVAALIKLTGILPTTAFNLIIPTLFSLTLCAVVITIYSLARRVSVALLGGYFAVLIGNFDGLAQVKGQVLAFLARLPLPPFDFWQSSRVIPFTINEFPFWTFLFADLHPHVIDLPIGAAMLALLASLLLIPHSSTPGGGTVCAELLAWSMLAAFIFGTIACVNPWDMPIYAILLCAALCIRVLRGAKFATRSELLIALFRRLVLAGIICVVGYLLYTPFYLWYQQLYVNGVGLVGHGSDAGSFLTVFGLWLFIALSFCLVELYRHWFAPYLASSVLKFLAASLLVGVVVVLALWLGGIKALLVLVLLPVIALFLFQLFARRVEGNAGNDYTYLLLLMGLFLCLGIEIVYIRDFLDGGDYERMNTVFKFSMQAWLCFAIGGALAVSSLWLARPGWLRYAWRITCVLLICCCSIFLFEGTAARAADHQVWASLQPPARSFNYAPTLDGFAFVRAWYPEDADAIAWLNQHVSGSPVILEATMPASYQWFNRVSTYTGLPDILGWPDHESEQRYTSQSLNRLTEINIIYSTTDTTETLELLRFYHVRYIYVGPVERKTYAETSSAGLDKFNQLVGSALRVVYNTNGVTIYQVV